MVLLHRRDSMRLITTSLITLIASCFIIIYVYAAEQKEVLLEYSHDVTGDGKEDQLFVYGVPFESNSLFFKKVWVEITPTEGKPFIINYEGGYEPKLDFVDLNHDGIDDILYSSATGGSGGLHNYAVHSVVGGKVEDLGIPQALPIEGYFLDDFQSILTIPGIESPIHLDLSDRKEDYLRLGLYQKNGKLNEPTELMISPIAIFEVTLIQNGFGLKGYQQVSGAYRADGIGTVMTTFWYENGKWEPIDVVWEENRG